eukprot:20113_1
MSVNVIIILMALAISRTLTSTTSVIKKVVPSDSVADISDETEALDGITEQPNAVGSRMNMNRIRDISSSTTGEFDIQFILSHILIAVISSVVTTCTILLCISCAFIYRYQLFKQYTPVKFELEVNALNEDEILNEE